MLIQHWEESLRGMTIGLKESDWGKGEDEVRFDVDIGI